MNATATIKENNIKLQLTRVFDAPRELVFKAWTDANQFKQWFGAAACDGASLESVKLDARVGGKYRLQVRRADGEFYTTVGTYREVKAPERLVFKAWTEPGQFRQWFGAAACDGATLLGVKVDARVGGKYRLQVRRPDGEYFTTAGAYREVNPPERLVFTWAFEKDGSGEEFGEVEPPEMLVTVEFKARGQQTELTLTHEKFASVESRDRHEDGWNRCLDSLGKFVEK